MSLLDDVSIVITPNGYKAGELYAVIPVPTEGAEEGTNMDFSSGTSPWALNSNWSLGGVGVIADGTSNSTIWQGSVLEDNKQYIVTYTLTDFLQGSVNVELSGSNGISRTIAGTYTEVITSGTSPTTRLSFEGSGNFKVTLSNVIVKEYTSADMDVTRNTAATRVDENGLVNYAEVLGGELVDEGSFPLPNTAWDVGGGTEITINGARINNTVTGVNAYISQLLTGTLSGKQFVLTYDVIATNGANLGLEQNSSIQLNTSTVGTNRKLYFTWDKYYNGFIIKRLTSGTDVTIDNVSVKEVTRDNVPRIDYTGGGCPHILAEPMRTNNLTASQDLTDSFWNSSTRLETVVASTVLSPDGTTFGFKAIPTTSNSTKYLDYDYGFLSMPSSSEVTYSIFVKPFGYTNFQLATSSGFSSRYQNFELTGDGIIGTGDVNGATIDKVGEWYRCSITQTTTGTTPRVLSIPTPSSGLGRNPTFTGNGTDGVLLWGASLEVGSYPTSYIPNLSTTSGSTVTRNQDIFTRDGIGSLINSTEGVLFVEIAAFADYTTYRYMGLTDGGSDNRVIILYYNSSTRIRVLLSSGGTKYFDAYYAVTSIEDFHKVALKWKENDFALWIDGVERATDTSGLAPIGLNTVALDQAGGDNFYGKVKQLQVYDTALTDEQLEALTT